METLVQIGNLKKRTELHLNKKNIIKVLQKKFPNEWDIVGGLSVTTKMPGFSISLPAKNCKTGANLARIKDSVCNKCYALRGNYLYKNVVRSHERRLFNLNHPLWVPSIARLIDAACEAIGEPYFRWHDAGDLQGLWHLENIIKVCELTPHINHWLPTREYQFLLARTFKTLLGKTPDNLVIRLSSHMIDGLPPSFPNTSSVSSNYKSITDKSIICGAYNRAGFCGTCRACWQKEIKDITYPKH